MSEPNRANPTPSRQPRPAPVVDRKVITPVPQRPSQIPGGGQHGYVPAPPPPPSNPTRQK